jgi:hypothetical protein
VEKKKGGSLEQRATFELVQHSLVSTMHSHRTGRRAICYNSVLGVSCQTLSMQVRTTSQSKGWVSFPGKRKQTAHRPTLDVKSN